MRNFTAVKNIVIKLWRERCDKSKQEQKQLGRPEDRGRSSVDGSETHNQAVGTHGLVGRHFNSADGANAKTRAVLRERTQGHKDAGDEVRSRNGGTPGV